MKKASLTKINFSLLTLTLSFNAAALECYIGSIAIADEGEAIGKLILLSGTPNGSRVWESKEYSRNITCKTGMQENVYFYPFPRIKSQPMPKGVEMGLIYNGKDLGTFNESSGNGNRATKIDTGWNLNRTTETRNFRIKAYLKKTGDIDTSKVTGAIHLFQLDGVGGLNGSANAKNYKFSLSQWNQTGTVNCSTSFANTSFRFPVGTNQSVVSPPTFTATPVLNMSCSSETPGLTGLVSGISGDFVLSGKAMVNASSHYETDREYFGYAVTHKTTAVTPGNKISLTVPLSGGKATYAMPFIFYPRLSVLKLNSPAWLFRDEEKEVKTKITPVFTPLSVTTN